MALRLVETATAASPAHADDPSAVATVRLRTLTRELRAPAWVAEDGDVIALLALDDLDTLPSRPRAQFIPGAANAPPITVRRQDHAPVAWDEATAQVTFRADDRLTPGDVGWLVQEARPRTQLGVPYGAILHAAGGPYVLRLRGDGQGFDRQPVRIGSIVNDLAVVVAGLHAGDRVALRDAFFLDADQRARGAGPAPAPAPGAEPPR